MRKGLMVVPPVLAAVAAALRRQDSPETEEAMGRSLRGREEDERCNIVLLSP